MGENTKPLPVVCALIERDGLVLLAQRPPHKHLGGKWEFPGGKIESGETPAEAIIREIREELACEFICQSELLRSAHHYEALSIEMIPIVGTLAPNSSNPQCREHTALVWIEADLLATYDLAPADYPIVEAYQQYLRTRF